MNRAGQFTLGRARWTAAGWSRGACGCASRLEVGCREIGGQLRARTREPGQQARPSVEKRQARGRKHKEVFGNAQRGTQGCVFVDGERRAG